jgi:hypothetical protein
MGVQARERRRQEADPAVRRPSSQEARPPLIPDAFRPRQAKPSQGPIIAPVSPARPPVIPPTSVLDDSKEEAPRGVSPPRPRPSGEGRKAETRGLASLRKNYGFESMSDTDDSEEESDDEDRPFDFDDAGNDMYYSKPMRR